MEKKTVDEDEDPKDPKVTMKTSQLHALIAFVVVITLGVAAEWGPDVTLMRLVYFYIAFIAWQMLKMAWKKWTVGRRYGDLFASAAVNWSSAWSS